MGPRLKGERGLKMPPGCQPRHFCIIIRVFQCLLSVIILSFLSESRSRGSTPRNFRKSFMHSMYFISYSYHHLFWKEIQGDSPENVSQEKKTFQMTSEQLRHSAQLENKNCNFYLNSCTVLPMVPCLHSPVTSYLQIVCNGSTSNNYCPKYYEHPLCRRCYRLIIK